MKATVPPEWIEEANASIAAAIEGEPPIKIKNPMVGGNLGQALNRAAREHRQLIRSMTLRENFKPCRKKCKKFKCNECFKKTFEEQMECYNNGGNTK